jgi:hypothetical protein
MGACVVVVARDTFAEVLSAHASYTDARNAIKGAVRSVWHPITPTLRSAIKITITTAGLRGAFVAVVWAHDIRARRRIRPEVTPDQRHQAKRANAQESE